jgi:phage host-nuclease inhibitor protein Gam
MTDLSDLGKQQREELIDVVTGVIVDTCDLLANKSARAVVEMLEKRGLVRFQRTTREIPYNPAWTHGEIGADEQALMEANGWRMRPDGSYFKPGS